MEAVIFFCELSTLKTASNLAVPYTLRVFASNNTFVFSVSLVLKLFVPLRPSRAKKTCGKTLLRLLHLHRQMRYLPSLNTRYYFFGYYTCPL